MAKTTIEWTEATWNPVTGCTKISPGCKHCYAERMALRLRAMGQPNYKNGFELTLHERMLSVPLSWKKSRMIFVNSMGDLFHENVPIDFIIRVFGVMKDAWWHRFQILTKRSSRLIEIDQLIDWPDNVWMGVSVEDEDYKFRIDHLRHTGAKTKFISFEPLLGPLDGLNINDIHWAIVGGESGPNARPMSESWVTIIRDRCKSSNVAFFFKQWGGVNRKRAGRILQGRIWDELPTTNHSDMPSKIHRI
jgi:protein gp37